MRILKWAVAVVLLCSVLGATVAMTWVTPRVARLALRVACPTVFVEDRSLDYAVDKLRNLGLLPVDITPFVSLHVDPLTRVVTAKMLGVASYSAAYFPGEGCVLQD